ncbi:peptidylprolyl isomerase, partial [Alcanivorax sp. HI0035]
GLKAGDRRSVFLEAKKAFGEYNDENVQHFTRDTFAQYDTLEPGMVLSFADAAGGELPGVISRVEDEWVFVDFNHPLAGRDLTFEVEIIAVERYAPEQPVTLN